MISLEFAKKLKDAGLKWVPEDGDCLHVDEDIIHVIEANTDRYFDCPDVWMPSLSQLLEEIEARGYMYVTNGKGECFDQYGISISNAYGFNNNKADTPEDAAADALLWIMEGRYEEVMPVTSDKPYNPYDEL